MTSETRNWRSVADLLTTAPTGEAALLGAPMAERSLTPGRCDLAPKAIRDTLARFSVYDIDQGVSLDTLKVFDGGDVDLKLIGPEQGFAPVRDSLARLIGGHRLTLLLGGNNAVTRPGVHGLSKGLGVPLDRIGLITLDAHTDLRDTDEGLTNGNPVRALLEDGLPGGNIRQIGLAPFANTEKMHRLIRSEGLTVWSIDQVRRQGIGAVVQAALDGLADRVDAIYADFDIDVIDRAQCPGAPGARPGGMAVHDFFAAARMIAGHPKVRAVDLTEFDPGLDVGQITALTAGRWVCEVLAGLKS